MDRFCLEFVEQFALARRSRYRIPGPCLMVIWRTAEFPLKTPTKSETCSSFWTPRHKTRSKLNPGRVRR